MHNLLIVLALHAFGAFAAVLSLGAINATIPLIIVLIFIGAAASVSRNFDIFSLFGVRAAFGLGAKKRIIASRPAQLAMGEGLSKYNYFSKKLNEKAKANAAHKKIKMEAGFKLNKIPVLGKIPIVRSGSIGVSVSRGAGPGYKRKERWEGEDKGILKGKTGGYKDLFEKAAASNTNLNLKEPEELQALKARYPNSEVSAASERAIKASVAANTPMVGAASPYMTPKPSKNGKNKSHIHVRHEPNIGIGDDKNKINLNLNALPSFKSRYLSQYEKYLKGKNLTDRQIAAEIKQGSIEHTNMNMARMRYLEEVHKEYQKAFDASAAKLSLLNADLQSKKINRSEYSRQKRMITKALEKKTNAYSDIIDGKNKISKRRLASAYSSFGKYLLSSSKHYHHLNTYLGAKKSDDELARKHLSDAEEHLQRFSELVAPVYKYDYKNAASGKESKTEKILGTATINGEALAPRPPDTSPGIDAKDPYDVLGVKPTDSMESIQKKYKILKRTWHPDKVHGDPVKQKEYEEKFKKIGAAFDKIKKEKEAKT